MLGSSSDPGMIWHPPTRQEPLRLPQRFMNTISEARAPFTGCLYALKWFVFSNWCTVQNEGPLSCDSASIMSFLQELLDVGHIPP